MVANNCPILQFQEIQHLLLSSTGTEHACGPQTCMQAIPMHIKWIFKKLHGIAMFFLFLSLLSQFALLMALRCCVSMSPRYLWYVQVFFWSAPACHSRTSDDFLRCSLSWLPLKQGLSIQPDACYFGLSSKTDWMIGWLTSKPSESSVPVSPWWDFRHT